MASQDEPRQGGWLSKWRAPKKREQQLATLQQGFTELVDLTRSIREHMDQQARTQKTLVDMMQHIPGAVEGLQSVGKATEQQTETLALLRKQLEAAARNEDHMVESMRSFNQTLTLMDDMSKRTSQTVSSMADRTRDSEDMLRTILERSERRLVYTIATLMVVTLTVLGAGLYIGFGGRSLHFWSDDGGSMDGPSSFEHKKSITGLGEESDPAATLVPVEDETWTLDTQEGDEETDVEPAPSDTNDESVDEDMVEESEDAAPVDDESATEDVATEDAEGDEPESD